MSSNQQDDLVALDHQPWMKNEVYYRYTCVGCGKEAKDTYVEPTRTAMRNSRLCFICNHWAEFERDCLANHTKMTIIGGSIYSPGNRTSGEFRGMAGRRFDIEYVEPSIYAGQRITTFDLWTGGTIPERLKDIFQDTAVFLNGAERCQVGETGCWEPSSNKTEPYKLPSQLVDGIDRSRS